VSEERTEAKKKNEKVACETPPVIRMASNPMGKNRTEHPVARSKCVAMPIDTTMIDWMIRDVHGHRSPGPLLPRKGTLQAFCWYLVDGWR
jgi:hypothetical protein